LFFSVPKNYVRFGFFQYFRDNIFTSKNKVNTFMCGLCAGAAEALFVVTPMETLKVKLIHDKLSEKPRYNNLFHGIYKIGQQYGFKGIYSGVVPTVIKQSSNQGVRFVVFEDAQKVTNHFIPIKLVADGVAGAFAGLVSTLANNPVDVVKTKMQGLHAQEYKGVVDCAQQIWKHEGIFGFYSGIRPRLARVCLDVGLTFSIFNGIKRALISYAAGKE
jgi:solute carrier family 25 citrate transporter 1